MPRHDVRVKILDAALGELQARGYGGTSMLSIATAAHSSKETLYRFFGDKRGLFEALVRHQAGAITAELAEALSSGDRPPEEVLRRFGRGLLGLLLGERAVAINRAAIAEAARSPELGQLLAEAGRGTTGPLVVRYLERQRARGRLDFPSAEEAFEVFLGLLLRDRQVRVLLGVMPAPDSRVADGLADRAVTYFMTLFGTTASSSRP